MFSRRSSSRLAREERKRELRAKIARQRLRIERRAGVVRAEAVKLRSWRTYVRRFPGFSLGAALVAGFLFSAGFPRRGASAWLVRNAIVALLATLRTSGYSELTALWRDLTAGKR